MQEKEVIQVLEADSLGAKPDGRQAEIESTQRKLEAAREQLEAVVDSPNYPASLFPLHQQVEKLEGRLRGLGLEPDEPSDEDIATARHEAGLDTHEDEPIDPEDSALYDPAQN